MMVVSPVFRFLRNRLSFTEPASPAILPVVVLVVVDAIHVPMTDPFPVGIFPLFAFVCMAYRQVLLRAGGGGVHAWVSAGGLLANCFC